MDLTSGLPGFLLRHYDKGHCHKENQVKIYSKSQQRSADIILAKMGPDLSGGEGRRKNPNGKAGHVEGKWGRQVLWVLLGIAIPKLQLMEKRNALQQRRSMST